MDKFVDRFSQNLYLVLLQNLHLTYKDGQFSWNKVNTQLTDRHIDQLTNFKRQQRVVDWLQTELHKRITEHLELLVKQQFNEALNDSGSYAFVNCQGSPDFKIDVNSFILKTYLACVKHLSTTNFQKKYQAKPIYSLQELDIVKQCIKTELSAFIKLYQKDYVVFIKDLADRLVRTNQNFYDVKFFEPPQPVKKKSQSANTSPETKFRSTDVDRSSYTSTASNTTIAVPRNVIEMTFGKPKPVIEKAVPKVVVPPKKETPKVIVTPKKETPKVIVPPPPVQDIVKPMMIKRYFNDDEEATVLSNNPLDNISIESSVRTSSVDRNEVSGVRTSSVSGIKTETTTHKTVKSIKPIKPIKPEEDVKHFTFTLNTVKDKEKLQVLLPKGDTRNGVSVNGQSPDTKTELSSDNPFNDLTTVSTRHNVRNQKDFNFF